MNFLVHSLIQMSIQVNGLGKKARLITGIFEPTRRIFTVRVDSLVFTTSNVQIHINVRMQGFRNIL